LLSLNFPGSTSGIEEGRVIVALGSCIRSEHRRKGTKKWVRPSWMVYYHGKIHQWIRTGGRSILRHLHVWNNPQNDAEERLLKMISMIFARYFRDFIFSTYDLGLP
jgi:hypothetical protein